MSAKHYAATAAAIATALLLGLSIGHGGTADATPATDTRACVRALEQADVALEALHAQLTRESDRERLQEALHSYDAWTAYLAGRDACQQQLQ